MICPVEIANEMSAFDGVRWVLLWRHMKHYSQAAVERTMKIQTLRQANSLSYGQEVIMRAMARKKTGYQAAEILGISCRQMRRMKERWEKRGYDGLFDRRRGKTITKTSADGIRQAEVQEVLRLYQEEYYDFNVKHFREKLQSEHRIKLS